MNQFLIESEDRRNTSGFFWIDEGEVFGMGIDRNLIVLLVKGRLISYHDGLDVVVEESEEMRLFSIRDNGCLLNQRTYKGSVENYRNSLTR